MMNQGAATTQLTLKGIASLLEEGKKGNVVQILEAEHIANQKPGSSSVKIKATISDGYTKHKIVLGGDAANIFQATGMANFCVVRILEFMQQNPNPSAKRIVVITKMEILNSDVKDTIGSPMEYTEWLSNNKQNLKGSNQIPSRYLPNINNSNQYNNNNNAMMNNSRSENSNSNSFNSKNSYNQEPPTQARNMTNMTNTPVNFNNPTMSKPNNMNNTGMNMGNMGNTGNMGNNQRHSFNPASTGNNFNKGFAQNENIPPYGNNQQKGNRRAGSMSSTNQNPNLIPDDEFMLVSQLVPGCPFVIKVRITNKDEKVRTYQKKGGYQNQNQPQEDGKVFSIEMIDKEGNEISGSFFGDSAEQFFPQIEQNQVYTMRGGEVRVINTNSKYPRRIQNDYQILFDRNSIIKPVEESSDIMLNKFDFKKLSECLSLASDSIVDIAAFVENPGDVQLINTKNGSKERRNIKIYDDSNILTEITLWGEQAKNASVVSGELLLFKGARVSEFNGNKTLSTTFTSKVISDPSLIPNDDPIIQQLRNWKMNNYSSDALQSIVVGDNRKMNLWTCDEINQALAMDTIEKAAFDVIGHVSMITSSGTMYYASCPGEKGKEGCRKKAEPFGEGMFQCTGCQKTFNAPVYRYTLYIRITDSTGSIMVSAFDKHGTTIMGGKDATSFHNSKGNNAAADDTVKEALNKEYNFRIFARKEDSNQGPKVRLQVTRVDQVPYVTDSQLMLNLLEDYATKPKLS